MARQHRITEVSKDAVVTVEIGRLELRCVFQNRHVFRSHFSGVDHRLQSVLRPDTVHVLLAVQHAALAGDAAERRIVPQDGELAVFRRLCFKARTMERNANFFEVTELLSCVAAVHVVNLLFSVN